MNDVERLLSIIHEAPLPFEKTDSQLAQEYRNWFYGVRSGRLKATEHIVHGTQNQRPEKSKSLKRFCARNASR